MSSAAPPDTPSSTSERRIAPRRQPAMGTVCRLDADVPGPSALALVWNISLTGISVLVSEPRPIGTPLTGFLERIEGEAMLRIAMRVVHAKKLDTGDFFLGAHFDRPLQPDELKAFVVD
jgi:hypothetical protein